MKRLLDSPRQGRTVTIELDGEPLRAVEGEPAACALLAAGEKVFARSVKYHRPRGPTCFAAACSSCLMRVDGLPNIFTCKTPVHDGMRLERQNAFPSGKLDVFASIDWMFPRGLDHHEMLAGVPVAEKVMAKVARHLAGLGVLPSSPAPVRGSAQVLHVPVCVVGAGAAGVAAATRLAEADLPHLVLEQEPFVGGWKALSTRAPLDVALSERTSLWSRTAAVGLYDDHEGKFLLAVHAAAQPQLLKVYAQRFLLCVGGQGVLPPFENNDLPGVFTAKAAAYLLHREGLLPGERIALVGETPRVEELARWMTGAGAQIVATVVTEGPSTSRIQKAHGPTKVRAVSIVTPDGRTKKLGCDAIIVAQAPSPSFELARQGGARVHFDGPLQTFVVDASESGATAATDVYVAGDAMKPSASFDTAERQGRAAAEAILADLAATVRA